MEEWTYRTDLPHGGYLNSQRGGPQGKPSDQASKQRSFRLLEPTLRPEVRPGPTL